MTDSDNDAFLVSSTDENPNWVLDSGSAYHFCRDKKMFSTYAACEGLVRMANNTTNKVVGKGTVHSWLETTPFKTETTKQVVGKGTVRFRMADGRSVTLTEGNKEMLRGRKTKGLYRLEGNVQTGRDAVRHGSSDIRRKNGQGRQQVHTSTQSKRRDTWRSQSSTQGDALRHVRKETNNPVKMNSSTSESNYRFSHTVAVKNSFQLDSRSKGKETASYRSWAQQTEESYQLQLALALRLSAEATCADDPNFLGPRPQ
ncbi:protein kinase superfamily protein [Actinidia rufa]|uniref:Protein kinase superfamily protein n=1 Tax=Actinidia rufa TaxID=165716 RepID=A0A7J0GK49_9ERIC|nr:protein kinase superfamily protein [Actinidia rufa]